MRLPLIFYSILASSLTKGMIFSFMPGGDAIKNVVSPFLSSFNTTDGEGNPTYTANLVRVVDPILAMQFARNDLVSSPEDYSGPLHPSYYAPQSFVDADRATDQGLRYTYYIYPGRNPPPESEFVADPDEFRHSQGPPSSFYVSARDPLDVSRAAYPAEQSQTLRGVFTPYRALPQENYGSRDVNDLKQTGGYQKLLNPYQYSRNPLAFTSSSNFGYAQNNQKLPYINHASVNPSLVNPISDPRSISDNQKLPPSSNPSPKNPLVSELSSDSGLLEGDRTTFYPYAGPSSVNSFGYQRAHGPILTTDSQKLTNSLNFVPINSLRSSGLSGNFEQIDNSQKLPLPQGSTLQNPPQFLRTNDPPYAEDLRTLPYPNNFATVSPVVVDPVQNSRSKLPYPLNLASIHSLKSSYDSLPKLAVDNEQIPYAHEISPVKYFSPDTTQESISYPLNVEGGNQLLSDRMSDSRSASYVRGLPYPINLAPANALASNQVNDFKVAGDYILPLKSPILAVEKIPQTKQASSPANYFDAQKLSQPRYNLPPMSPVDVTHARNPGYTNDFKKPFYPNEILSIYPTESSSVSDRQNIVPVSPRFTNDLSRTDDLLPPSPPKFASVNSLNTNLISNPEAPKYNEEPSAISAPINVLEIDPVNYPLRSEDGQEISLPYNSASMSPILSDGVANLKYVEKYPQIPYLRSLASLKSDRMRDARLQAENTVTPISFNPTLQNYGTYGINPVESGERANSKHSDEVADPRHIIPMIRRGFDLFNPWVDFPALYPVAPGGSYGPNRYQHNRRLRPEIYRDEDDAFFPSDYYLTDYVYPMDDYPVIERFSEENSFEPRPDSLVSSSQGLKPGFRKDQPNAPQPILTSRMKGLPLPFRSADDHPLRSLSEEVPSPALDQIQPPFRTLIEKLLQQESTSDEILPIHRSLIKSLLSGNSGLNPKLDAFFHRTVDEPTLGASLKNNLKSGDQISDGLHTPEYQRKAANPTAESFRVQLNPNLPDDAKSSSKPNGISPSGSSVSVNIPKTSESKPNLVPSGKIMPDAKSVPGQRGVENHDQLNSQDSYRVPQGQESAFEAGRIQPSLGKAEDAGSNDGRLDARYRTRYDPLVQDPYLGCFDWLNPKGKFEEDLFSAKNPFAKILGSKPKSSYPVATNNINYGIVEPNYGNYPIYSFDNTNPVQNFNHQTNPVFHPAEPSFQPPGYNPSIWDLSKKPGNVIVSPIKKPLFTPYDNAVPVRYADEEVQFFKALTNNVEPVPLPAPVPVPVTPAISDFNADGVRTNWPRDPKTLVQGDPSKGETPQVPTVPEAQPGKIPALVIIPAKDQGNTQEQDSSVSTINTSKNYNLLPIQLPASFLNNLINSGLFSAFLNNLPGSDPIAKTKAPGTLSLLSPVKHQIELYNPTLRGYHGGINPFAHHHTGVGYKAY
ncbi:unnamed protein product [Bemisia tabaci]|uniref:Uncharacterized protein n=1 Tax=Bemisia tabaci TaxID=7038 RepID=A0A9P0A6R0_BEMTA|nr:unnamed protein product [Bemisia tabaci]